MTPPPPPSAAPSPFDASALFKTPPNLVNGVLIAHDSSASETAQRTTEAFSEKWQFMSQAVADEDEGWKQMQLEWYLDLYGYQNEGELSLALRDVDVVLDAGCGQGYKAAWLARLAPNSLVVGMDASESVFAAAVRYADVPNLVFAKGDIARTGLRDSVIGLINCDQVLHHTESPPETLGEFQRIGQADALLHTYVYARKALPRELLDDHFRQASASQTHEALWELSRQLTELGRKLSELNVTLDVPQIPALGITGGPQDLQRFVYWNFLKCFWNPDLGWDASVAVNYDWYAPSIAFRYTQEAFLALCVSAGWTPEYIHGEPACWSGRFRSPQGGNHA